MLYTMERYALEMKQAEYRNYIERRINLAGYEVEICRGDSVIKKEQMKVGDNDE